jgi:hypothetical protein
MGYKEALDESNEVQIKMTRTFKYGKIERFYKGKGVQIE